MANFPAFSLIGTDTLIGREVRDLFATSGLSLDLRLIAAEAEQAGTLTEIAGEPAVVTHLETENLSGSRAVFLAGTPDSSRKALELARQAAEPPALIDLTYGCEDAPEARLYAPAVQGPAGDFAVGAVAVIAHPAAIATALVLRKLHQEHPITRSIVHIFEPASERGAGGIEELQQQTISLLSFKGMPKRIFDAQLSFNLLARYGEEAPFSLEDVELRIERHLATLFSTPGPVAPPMPSLRLIQVPVFHGHSYSLWVEFQSNPGVEGLQQALSTETIDVRGTDLEPPTAVGVAGESGVSVGAITLDRNHPQACWIWMAADNIRLAGENAVMLARQLL